MAKDEVKISDIAKAAGVSVQAIHSRIKKEGWIPEPQKKQGGALVFAINSLPEGIREIVKVHLALEDAGGAHKPHPHSAPPLEREGVKSKEEGLALFSASPENKQRLAEAKRDILTACKGFLDAAGYKTKRHGDRPWSKKGVLKFVDAYNLGQINITPHPGPLPMRGEGNNVIEAVSYRSIVRWKKAYEKEGIYGLVNRYKSVSHTSVAPDQQDFIVSLVTKHPHISNPKIMAAMEARFLKTTPHPGPLPMRGEGEKMPSEDSVRRWVNKWKRENASFFLYMTNPDEWRSRYMAAVGSASAGIERLNQRWEMDSTPGDIMLIDGRYTVIGVIDVYSRRVKLLVCPTSNSEAIAALFRRAVIDWGVPEEVKTDNGKDYTAKHLERVIESLEVAHTLCAPFSPEEKPHIERSLGTFSHGIVELLPGYIGHSVADRKAIEARRSFASRMMKQKEAVEVKMTSEEFQKVCDRWVNAIYHQNPHAGLSGRTPWDVAREYAGPVRKIANERALDVLLHPAPGDGGLRTVSKKGVRVEGREYISMDLIGLEGRRVMTLIDSTDLGHLYVFDEGKMFICVAECPEWTGISRKDLASHIKAKQKALLAVQKKEYKQMSRELKIDAVPEEILNYREQKIATILTLPGRAEEYTTTAVEEAGKAAGYRKDGGREELMAGKIMELPAEVIEAEERILSIGPKLQQRRFAEQWDIYTFIIDRMKEGVVSDTEKEWKKCFDYWTETGKKVGLMLSDPYLVEFYKKGGETVLESM